MIDPKRNMINEKKNIVFALNLRDINALNGIMTPTTSRKAEYDHCSCVDETEKSLIRYTTPVVIMPWAMVTMLVVKVNKTNNCILLSNFKFIIFTEYVVIN